MKQILALLFALLSLPLQAHLGLSARPYDHLYHDLPTKLKPVEEVRFPTHTVSLSDFGGVGDGLTPNTEAFRKAIESLSERGGGTLHIPQGVWLTGPIELADSIRLHLAPNAIVYFSPDKRLFVDTTSATPRGIPAIRAVGRRNIAITGGGIIDGNGAQWRPVKRGKVSDVEWKRFQAQGGVERDGGKLWYPWNATAGHPNVASTPEGQEALRSDLIRLTECENVLIEGVTVQNSPRFHVHPVRCRNVIIDGVTVRCPWNAQNGDAIDLSDCHQALVTGCTIDAGDDGLCLKSGTPKAGALANGCQDILMDGNTVFHAHGGFVIGSEDIAGVRRVVVRNCRFSGTDTGLRFKSAIGRGGLTDDIHISHIVMSDINGAAITFQCNYVNRPAGHKDEPTAKETTLENVPEFVGIHISHVVCRGAGTAISAHGIEGLRCVHDVSIDHSTFIYNNVGYDIDASTAQIRLDSVTVAKESPGRQ